MAVGGMGMLSTSNYAARKFGVRAGMPGFIGKKLCPDLVLVKPNFKRYKEISEVVRGVFREYDPNFSPMSLDEAYLDITDHLEGRAEGVTASEVVEEIRAKIEQRTQLTASAGIAPNARLAKICSDRNKPNGQCLLPADVPAIEAFVRDLPIRKVNGVGNVSEQMLAAVGVLTCGDLWEQRGCIKLLFSETSATHFLNIALGLGSTRLADWNERERKSLSTETTFRDTDNPAELQDICATLCADLSRDLVRHGLEGRQVTLKIKTDTFRTKTKVLNLFEHTTDARVIEAAARQILRQLAEAAEEKPLRLRLMGVRMSEFKSEDGAAAPGRQKTLTSFLKKEAGAPPTAKYTCPCCGEEVAVPGERAFNAHLDQCLEKKQEKQEEGCDDESLGKLGSEPSRSTGEALRDHSKGMRAPPVPEEKEKEEEGTVECPVCGSSEVPQSEINAHIDVCLNRGVLGRIQEGGRKREADGGASARESKKAKRGIESYFSKKSGAAS